MICIPKLALEIQDLSLPVTVLLPRLDDNRALFKMGATNLPVAAASNAKILAFDRAHKEIQKF